MVHRLDGVQLYIQPVFNSQLKFTDYCLHLKWCSQQTNQHFFVFQPQTHSYAINATTTKQTQPTLLVVAHSVTHMSEMRKIVA